MWNATKTYLKQEKPATGGLLFMTVALIIASMFIFTVTFSRATISRSVAESVEHTLAMECLASCYINPNQPALSGTGTTKERYWKDASSDVTFQSLSTSNNAQQITPLTDFNEIMTELKLVRTNERPGAPSYESGDLASAVDLHYKYFTNNDPQEGYKAGQAIFDLQVKGYTNQNPFWDSILRIQPNAVRVTIENSYSGNEDDFS